MSESLMREAWEVRQSTMSMLPGISREQDWKNFSLATSRMHTFFSARTPNRELIATAFLTVYEGEIEAKSYRCFLMSYTYIKPNQHNALFALWLTVALARRLLTLDLRPLYMFSTCHLSSFLTTSIFTVGTNDRYTLQESNPQSFEHKLMLKMAKRENGANFDPNTGLAKTYMLPVNSTIRPIRWSPLSPSLTLYLRLNSGWLDGTILPVMFRLKRWKLPLYLGNRCCFHINRKIYQWRKSLFS
ncbi:MAG: hypothetical protein K6L75_03575 [Cellvibrionaceae bacterium]